MKGVNMVYVVVDHKVADYAKWKPAFDKHAETRMKFGSKGGTLFHIFGEPDHPCILFEFDTMDNAKKFYESEDLKKVMQDAGVLGKPDIWFLDKIEDFKV
jgi:uncharacterized protein (DUF1330 family)